MSPATCFLGGLGAGIVSALVIAWLTRNRRGQGRQRHCHRLRNVCSPWASPSSARKTVTRLDLSTHILFRQHQRHQSERPADSGGDGRGGVLLIIALLYKEFQIISFDLSLAHSLRLPVEFLRILLLILIALTIVASLQAVGIALMLALLIDAGGDGAPAGEAAASHDRHRQSAGYR